MHSVTTRHDDANADHTACSSTICYTQYDQLKMNWSKITAFSNCQTSPLIEAKTTASSSLYFRLSSRHPISNQYAPLYVRICTYMCIISVYGSQMQTSDRRYGMIKSLVTVWHQFSAGRTDRRCMRLFTIGAGSGEQIWQWKHTTATGGRHKRTEQTGAGFGIISRRPPASNHHFTIMLHNGTVLYPFSPLQCTYKLQCCRKT